MVDVAPEYRMEEIEVAEGCEGVGAHDRRHPGRCDHRRACARADGTFHPQPPSATVLSAGDVVMAMGTLRTVQRLEALFAPATARRRARDPGRRPARRGRGGGRRAWPTAGATKSPPTLERPKQAEHGDYATNAALLLAPLLKAPPREVAERLGGALRDRLGDAPGARRGRRARAS